MPSDALDYEIAVDWRGLFDHLRIEWKDRGRNCQKGKVNIRCPFCGNADPSQHLALHEGAMRFACLRDTRHWGVGERAIISLLHRMDVPRDESISLLDRFARGAKHRSPEERREPASLITIGHAWRRFESAATNPTMIGYLRSRGFTAPIPTIQKYGLTFAPRGPWALRLLIPYVIGAELHSWAGRAVYPHLSPKYLINGDDGGLIYVPRRADRWMVVVEGQIDALKIAVAGEDLPVSSVALSGKSLPPLRLNRLRELTRDVNGIYVCLDADVVLGEAMTILAEIRAATGKPCKRLKLPPGYGDAGALPLDVAKRWLIDALKNF